MEDKVNSTVLAHTNMDKKKKHGLFTHKIAILILPVTSYKMHLKTQDVFTSSEEIDSAFWEIGYVEGVFEISS